MGNLKTIDNGRLVDGDKIDNLPDDTNSELDLKQDLSEKGEADGYASLGDDGKVPEDELPDYALCLGNVISDDNITDNSLIKGNGGGKGIQGSDFILNDDNSISFPEISPPTHSEGKVFYDSTKKAISYYNEEGDIVVNVGQELLFRVYNDTGDTISNGSIVTNTIDGLQLADNRYKDKANLIAMATHDIEDGSFGYATRLGEVGGIDTSTCESGTVVYLGTDGGYQQTRPDDGHYSVIIGVCKTVSETDGIIQVNPVTSQLTVEVTDTNGFPETEKANTSMSFVDGTRTFTISSSSYPFHYYITGDKYEINTSESLIIDDIEGLHVIYYDGDTLTSLNNPTSSEISGIIKNYAIITYIYWDATNSIGTYFAEERHGISMSPVTHDYLHFTRGAQYLNGLGLGDFVIDDGDVNTHAQFSISSGNIADEDLTIEYDEIISTTGLPIYYLEGTSGNLRRKTQSGFSVSTFDGTNATRLEYNEWTGTTWQLTEVSSNDFVLYHIFAINGYEGEDQQISVIGQNEYGTRAQARAGASTEISSILLGFPFEEIVPIGTVIFQTNLSYDNDVNAKIVQDAEGNDYVDWRSTELAQGISASDHGNLTGLSDDDHSQYLLLEGRSGGQEFYGGIDSGDDLFLSSTSNATKGFINLGDTCYVDEVNGNVGIRTTSPARTLEIVGIARSSESGRFEAITATGGTAYYILGDTDDIDRSWMSYDNSIDQLSWKVNGKEDVMVIDSSGNVGIGTTSPTVPLHVTIGSETGIADGGEIAMFQNADSASSNADITVISGAEGRSRIQLGDTGDRDKGYIEWDHSTDKLNIGYIGSNDVITMDTSGNVGIGTDSPSYKLDVDGNINIDSESAYLFDGAHAVSLAKGADSYYANTYVGLNAGNSSSTKQTAIGYSAGLSNTGIRQTTVGYNTGYLNTGNYQTAIGYNTGRENTGVTQIAIGHYAGYLNTGNYQTAIGHLAGRENTGDNVVAIGYQAGYLNTEDNQFIIKQATVNSVPLIQGDFSSGNVGIGTTSPNSTLEISGDFAVKRKALAVSGTTSDEVIIGITSTATTRTITLQTADNVEGRIYIIKDESGGAGTNNITIATEGSETIDGNSTAIISDDYGVVRIYSNGTNFFTI